MSGVFSLLSSPLVAFFPVIRESDCGREGEEWKRDRTGTGFDFPAYSCRIPKPNWKY